MCLREKGSSHYLWRVLLYSHTGLDGPYDRIDFFESNGKLHRSVFNSRFRKVGDVSVPTQMEVRRADSDIETYSVRRVLVNEEVDPAIFQPIAPIYGTVVFVHEKDNGGNVSTTRFDLPRMDQLNAMVNEAVMAPDSMEQPVVVRPSHSHETEVPRDDVDAQGNSHESTKDGTDTDSLPVFEIIAAIVLIFCCGGLLVIRSLTRKRRDNG